MAKFYVPVTYLLLATLFVVISCSEPKKKLQIGVLRRVENCSSRTKKGDFLNVNYVGKLEDGTEFDNSYDRKQPLGFTVGSRQVIAGWDQGMLGMCVGEKRKLIIPHELGYGEAGAPPKIPGGATLIFEVELVSIGKAEL